MEFKYGKVFLKSEREILIFYYLLDVYKYFSKRYKAGRRGAERVQIFTNDFKAVVNYYTDKKSLYWLETIKPKVDSKKIFGIRLFNFIEIIDTKYKYGTDEYGAEDIFNSEIEFKTWNSGFNGYAKRKICMEEIQKEFAPVSKSLRAIMINKMVKGPIISCRPGKDFQNVWAYDIKSAYPYWIDKLEFPCKFLKSKEWTGGDHMIHFGRVVIKNLMAKNPNYLPLFLKQTPDRDDYGVINVNRRVLAAEQYSGYVFMEDFKQIIQNYNYSSIEIDWTQFWNCETKLLPEESRAAIKELFNRKEQTKKHADKLILNRSAYGLFITHKELSNGEKDAADYKVPYQVGAYIVSHQAAYMDSVIQKCGVSHLIAAHTDSIKFDYDVSEIVKEENKRVSYSNLGSWEKENVERCYYFSNTRAKLIADGKLEIKHGGIDKKIADKFVQDNTYDTITENSEIELIIERYIKTDENGTEIVERKRKSFFNEEEEN